MATECSLYSTISIIPSQLCNSFKLRHLHLGLYITMQKAVILDTCSIIQTFLADL